VTLEHLGIAVREADEAIELFSALLGARPYKVESVEREGVRTHFFGDAGAPGRSPKIELLEVTDSSSPVVRFLERRGPGLHHVAFEVDDLPVALARLRAAGFQPVSDEPAPGADGKRVAFLHPRSAGGVLIELCESDPAVERLDVSVADGTVAVFVSGPPDGPPLVVLHGALGSTAMETDRVARRWAADYRVVAVDFRGHGASSGFDSAPLSVETLAEDVLAVLDAVGVESAHVFGFSLGAAVALYTAWKYPERVRRVVTLGANVRWVDDEVRNMTAAMRAALDAPEGRWARKLAQCHGPDHWRGLANRTIDFTRRLPARPFPDEGLRSIAAPVLVVHGDRDRYFDLRHAVHLRRALRDAQLWVIPGADHPIRKLDARVLAREAAAFLRR
jgi:methylmalonyl-CoA epimerase